MDEREVSRASTSQERGRVVWYGKQVHYSSRSLLRARGRGWKALSKDTRQPIRESTDCTASIRFSAQGQVIISPWRCSFEEHFSKNDLSEPVANTITCTLHFLTLVKSRSERTSLSGLVFIHSPVASSQEASKSSLVLGGCRSLRTLVTPLRFSRSLLRHFQ
jgi:hypothetical protein